MMFSLLCLCLLSISCNCNEVVKDSCINYRNEFIETEIKLDEVDYSDNNFLKDLDLPLEHDWGNIDGKSYLTKNLNQHIPQYCGSCWAHGALSALGDRIKIMRGGKSPDINLSIQFILNCGKLLGGSCYGGNHHGAYRFIQMRGYVPYDTCLSYEACSSDSDEGYCGKVDYSCNDLNICRTCSTFTSNGGKCVGIKRFPNASIIDHGRVRGVSNMKMEIFKNGPIAVGVNAEPLVEYKGGIFDDSSASRGINHVVSINGWGYDKESDKQYWIARNSWGEYWGEMGNFRIAMGDNQLGIEDDGAWAIPGNWTELNYPCNEDGSNC